MNLSVGIVGLPNVGKSTLFNALLKKQVALAANYPFATIEPNVGVVGVPDKRLEFLAETVAAQKSNSKLQISNHDLNSNYEFPNKDKWPPIKPATVKFVDIAGLVAGASKGEGLGNKFLAHIREVDAIAQVVRDFTDENVIRAGAVEPKSDFEVIETEMMLADLETVTRMQESKDKEVKMLAGKIRDQLEKGVSVRTMKFSEEEEKAVKQINLLSAKPVIVVLNVDEKELTNFENKIKTYPQWDTVVISAKLEAELAELPEGEQAQYLADLGIAESGLERLITKAFDVLGLQTFLTAGEIEARAWTIKKGAKAPEAAGVIHTDFEKHFIKADVVDWQDFVKFGGWEKAREAGKVRLEGREYVMQEGDVVEFKVGA